jgi:protein subunit release factor A
VISGACERILDSLLFFLLCNIIALEKENEDDPDMSEMIASELEVLSNQLAELEEKLKVNRT